MVLTFESVDENLKCDHSNAKATEQNFPVVLFITLHKVVLTIEFVDDILKCNHSNEPTKQYSPVVMSIMPYEVVRTFDFSRTFKM